MNPLYPKRVDRSPVHDTVEQHEYMELYRQLFKTVMKGNVDIRGTLIRLIIGSQVTFLARVVSSTNGSRTPFLEPAQDGRFVPVCFGGPGEVSEVLQALREGGCWIGTDFSADQSQIEQIKTLVARFRNRCGR